MEMSSTGAAAAALAKELKNVAPEEKGESSAQTDVDSESICQGIIKFEQQNASHVTYRRREVGNEHGILTIEYIFLFRHTILDRHCTRTV